MIKLNVHQLNSSTSFHPRHTFGSSSLESNSTCNNMHKSLHLTSWKIISLKKELINCFNQNSIIPKKLFVNFRISIHPVKFSTSKQYQERCQKKKKNWLTFSSLNHFPWQSRFQPAAINFSSLSQRSWKSKCAAAQPHCQWLESQDKNYYDSD